MRRRRADNHGHTSSKSWRAEPEASNEVTAKCEQLCTRINRPKRVEISRGPPTSFWTIRAARFLSEPCLSAGRLQPWRRGARGPAGPASRPGSAQITARNLEAIGLPADFDAELEKLYCGFARGGHPRASAGRRGACCRRTSHHGCGQAMSGRPAPRRGARFP